VRVTNARGVEHHATCATDGPLGYSCMLFEKDRKGGGLMRGNIPSFRLPATSRARIPG